MCVIKRLYVVVVLNQKQEMSYDKVCYFSILLEFNLLLSNMLYIHETGEEHITFHFKAACLQIIIFFIKL